MGSYIEVNDTLQITKEQGFPKELILSEHEKNPFKAEDFKDRVFEFCDKPGVRIFQAPPVRVFFVENTGDKWIYWGLVHILEVKHDLEKKTTSGKYKIIDIFPVEDIKKAFRIVDQRPDFDFFKEQ